MDSCGYNLADSLQPLIASQEKPPLSRKRSSIDVTSAAVNSDSALSVSTPVKEGRHPSNPSSMGLDKTPLKNLWPSLPGAPVHPIGIDNRKYLDSWLLEMRNR